MAVQLSHIGPSIKIFVNYREVKIDFFIDRMTLACQVSQP
jgi:hypothetical protein